MRKSISVAKFVQDFMKYYPFSKGLSIYDAHMEGGGGGFEKIAKIADGCGCLKEGSVGKTKMGEQSHTKKIIHNA